jgi:hypothetical protein
MSLQVQKMLSMRWRIGARCSSWGWLLVRRGCGVICDAGLSAGVLDVEGAAVLAARRFSSLRRGRWIVASSSTSSASNSWPQCVS